MLAIDKDVEQTTAIIQKIEELIFQAKIEKGVNNIYKEAYKNKEEDDDTKKNNLNLDNPSQIQLENTTKKTQKDGKLKETPQNCNNCFIF